MLAANLADTLAHDLGGMFEFEPFSETKLRVQTPLRFPDGDLVDVFVLEEDGRLWVTDYGDTFDWLDSQCWESGLTDAERRIVQRVCLSFGVEFNHGQLEQAVKSADKLADEILTLAQASARIADRCYIHRRPDRLFPSDGGGGG